MLSSPACSTPSSLTPDSDTDSEFPSSLLVLMQTSSDSETSPESTEAGEGSELNTLHPPLLQKTDAKNVDLKVFSSFWPVAIKVWSSNHQMSIKQLCGMGFNNSVQQKPFITLKPAFAEISDKWREQKRNNRFY